MRPASIPTVVKPERLPFPDANPGSITKEIQVALDRMLSDIQSSTTRSDELIHRYVETSEIEAERLALHLRARFEGLSRQMGEAVRTLDQLLEEEPIV